MSENIEFNDEIYHAAKDKLLAFIRNAGTLEEISAIGKTCEAEFETLVMLEKINPKRYTVIPFIKASQKFYKNLLEQKHFKI